MGKELLPHKRDSPLEPASVPAALDLRNPRLFISPLRWRASPLRKQLPHKLGQSFRRSISEADSDH
jgi:hypothetical protein